LAVALDPVSIGSQPRHRRVDVLGVPVSAVTIGAATTIIGNFIEDDARAFVTVTSVHGIVESLNDDTLLRVHNDASMVTPDGMPLVWCCRFAGAAEVERTYGPDLMLAVCGQAAKKGWKIYLYGAAPGVAAELGSPLAARNPGLEVVGTYSPPYRPLTDEEDEYIVHNINSSGADIVWVGLSTPRQERWMYEHVGRLDASVLIGVGAAFDFHSGNVRQAPRWMQRGGLEWFFRLCTEPRRLWRRYLLGPPKFVRALAHDRPTLRPE